MTRFNVKAAVLKAAQENKTISIPFLMRSFGISEEQALTSLKRLRYERRILKVGEDAHAYIQGSVPMTRDIDAESKERHRRHTREHRMRQRVAGMPIVQAALVQSPVSIWAYARGFA